MGIFRGFRHSDPYITEAGLSALKNNDYKYSCEDKSLVSKYFTLPFARLCLRLVPLTMAPNLLTLLGFFCAIFFPIAYFIYSPSFSAPPPAWMAITGGILIFVYQTLDNMDGNQARKTKTGSPMGQLFDHGCDSFSCGMTMMGCALAIGCNATEVVVITFGGLFSFAVCNWEEFHTHQLYLGYVNGPTEGLLMMAIMEVVVGLLGQDMFHRQLLNIRITQWAAMFLVVGSMITSIHAIWNVVRLFHCKSRVPEQEQPLTQEEGEAAPRPSEHYHARSLSKALITVIPAIVFPIMGLLWFAIDRIFFDGQPSVTINLFPMCLIFMLSTSLYVADLIVCRVALMRPPSMGISHLLLFVFLGLHFLAEILLKASTLQFMEFITQHSIFLWVLLTVVSLLTLHFVVSVLRTLSTLLNVNIITITPDQRARIAQLFPDRLSQ